MGSENNGHIRSTSLSISYIRLASLSISSLALGHHILVRSPHTVDMKITSTLQYLEAFSPLKIQASRRPPLTCDQVFSEASKSQRRDLDLLRQ